MTPPSSADDPGKVNFLYVTAPNRQAALALARALVQDRLAACANVIDGATSVYWWDGAVQEENEAILILKTSSEKTSETISKIKELHEYSVPCVVALPVVDGNSDFLHWVRGQTL